VKFLSGGERNRVLLARLFAKPANVIVLDEPTNDLDAETLEMLEERLVEFSGTVLVVSHDRAFLDNVVTSTLVFEPVDGGPGEPSPGRPLYAVREYVGGYADWLRQRPPGAVGTPAARPVQRPRADESPTAAANASASAGTVASPAVRKRKLSFKEQQELAALPALIESLEQEIARLHAAMAAPDFYRQPGDVLAGHQSLLRESEQRLLTAFARWEALE
jgi:ATP-binding cassette subfamily F protein uup